MAFLRSTVQFLSLAAALLAGSAVAQTPNTGYATYSNTAGGVCTGSSNGLPGVSINAAQFGGGQACGQCVQIQGTGNGAGTTPVSTAPYVAVIMNVCPQCAYGDLDLQEQGNGKFGITWSFVSCPGAGRKLIEDSADTAAAPQNPVESPMTDAAAPAVEEVLLIEQVPLAAADILESTTAAVPTVKEILPVEELLATADIVPEQRQHQQAQPAEREAASPTAVTTQSISRKLLRGN